VLSPPSNPVCYRIYRIKNLRCLDIFLIERLDRTRRTKQETSRTGPVSSASHADEIGQRNSMPLEFRQTTVRKQIANLDSGCLGENFSSHTMTCDGGEIAHDFYPFFYFRGDCTAP
jgi:hypothetical protein